MRIAGWAAVVFLVWGADDSHAQARKVSDVIAGLYGGDGITLAVTNHPLEHSAHFQAASAAAINRFNVDFGRELKSMPIVGASPPGASLTFDPAVGGYVPALSSLGWFVGEHSRTVGAGRWDLGVRYSSVRFDTFEGRSLGSIPLQVPHVADVIDPPESRESFENDRLLIELDIAVSAEILTFHLVHGLTNNIDLTLAVPVLQLDLSAAGRASIEEAVPADSPFSTSGVHAFDPAQDPPSDAASGQASGIGDMLIGLKYHLGEFDRASLGAGLTIRLATGDRFDLLGSGTTVFRPFVVTDYQLDPDWSAYGNLGLEAVNDDGTWRGALRPIGGVSFGAARWTVAAELAGLYAANGDDVGDQRTDLTLGWKWRLPRAEPLLMSIDVQQALDDGGLRADTVLAVGVNGRF